MENAIRTCQASLIGEKRFDDHGLNSTSINGKATLSTSSQQQPLNNFIPGLKLNHLITNPSAVELKSDEVQLADMVKNLRLRMKRLVGNSLEELVMIDTIQRLGMDHLFQEEIREVLHQHYVEHFSEPCDVDHHCNDLHEVSLRFRLLRGEGYNISAHTFDHFLDQDGKFNRKFVKDTEGLVSLFEASQMSMLGEYILDEANAFSKQLLSSSLENPNESQTMLVQNTLKHPFQKSLAKFMAQDFLSTLSNAKGWRSELRALAKMDFNMAQTIYEKEILHVSKWWEKLGLAKELKFARDQPVKWHMWSLAALPDPSMSKERIEMTKPISLVYIIDDVFDVYGTPEELSLFTEAVNRWEFDTLEMLPDYMKVCLKAVFDVTNEISQGIWLKYGYNPKVSLQKVWTDLFNAFLVESKWLVAGHLPTTAEYLKIATVTSGLHVALAHMYFLLGGGSHGFECDRQVVNWDYTRIISSAAMILRLWDDLGSSEDEGQDGLDGSYIKCYMNEREGVSIDDVREHVLDLIADTWKSLNEESLQSPDPYLFSSARAFTNGCLNIARMVPLMYSYDEDHKLPDLQKFIKSLLYQRC